MLEPMTPLRWTIDRPVESLGARQSPPLHHCVGECGSAFLAGVSDEDMLTAQVCLQWVPIVLLDAYTVH